MSIDRERLIERFSALASTEGFGLAIQLLESRDAEYRPSLQTVAVEGVLDVWKTRLAISENVTRFPLHGCADLVRKLSTLSPDLLLSPVYLQDDRLVGSFFLRRDTGDAVGFVVVARDLDRERRRWEWFRHHTYPPPSDAGY